MGAILRLPSFIFIVLYTLSFASFFVLQDKERNREKKKRRECVRGTDRDREKKREGLLKDSLKKITNIALHIKHRLR